MSQPTSPSLPRLQCHSQARAPFNWIKLDTWNEASIKAAWDENTPAEIKGFTVYAASKAEGERAAFNLVKKNNPGFVFNSVLPDYTLLEGNEAVMNLIVSQYFIDAKDLARLLAIALLDPSVKSERLFGLAAPYTWQDVIDSLRELRPSAENLVNNVPPAREGFVQIVPTERSKVLLGSFFGQKDWTSLKDSLDTGITGLGL
ncbi:hypothetical protein BDV12DRAFT_191841 [Aspergillus spectabilis]